MGPRSLKNSHDNVSLPRQPQLPTVGSTYLPRGHRKGWGWLFLIAPGRLLVVYSPLSAIEVERRLRQQTNQVRFSTPHRIIIRLPTARTERRFFAWIESDSDTPPHTRIVGQTRTPARIALIRVTISLVLFWLALFWFSSAHAWLGILLAFGCAGFLLLSQYERLTERDRRLYIAWLRQVVDAETTEKVDS